MPQFKNAMVRYHVPTVLMQPAHVVAVLVRDFVRADLPKQASAMAYTLLLSLIPSLVAIFCVISLFSPMIGNGTDFMDQVREFILENLASGSGESAVGYLDSMLSHISLASIGWSSFASVLVTLILLLRQIEIALNYIWLVNKDRNAFTRFMYFWTFLTLGVVVLGIVIASVSGLDLKHLVEPSTQVKASIFGGFISWITAMSGGFLFFLFLYRVVPNCYVAMKSASTGALVAAFLLNQASRLYGLYVRDAKSYTTLYGAIAQLPLFLTWLYICWIIILFGALVSWRVQEGFPKLGEEGSLDRAKEPSDLLRNSQIKATLPMMVLLAIYKNYQAATGKPLSGQQLAQSLKLPINWVAEALTLLQKLGYVVAGKSAGIAVAQGHGAVVADPQYPAFPPEAVRLAKLDLDLGSPMQQWLDAWPEPRPLDIRRALQFLAEGRHGPQAPETLLQVLNKI